MVPEYILLTSIEKFRHIKGDHSGSSQPPVDIKTKVVFQYKPFILKHNFCFHVNRRLGTT